MNTLLKNGNIEASYGVWGNGIHTTLSREIPPSDPDYLRYTTMMTTEDEIKARKVHEKYLATHPTGS